MDEGIVTRSSSLGDVVVMAGCFHLSKEEVQASVDVRAMVTAKSDNLRNDFIEKTLDEVAQRGWV